ncbi:hypothetical protein CCP3SC1_430031 [Gammaproteobacteria bacterium]
MNKSHWIPSEEKSIIYLVLRIHPACSLCLFKRPYHETNKVVPCSLFLYFSLITVAIGAVPGSNPSTILATKRNQTITLSTTNPTTLVVGAAATVGAGATSDLPVRFVSSTSSICTTVGGNGSVVVAAAPGNCIVVASQSGNANYNAATPQNIRITVKKVSQTIGAITFELTNLAVNGTTIVVANAISGLPVTFSSQTPSICTVGGPDNDTVTGITGGTCIIVANQAGDATHSATSKQKTIVVSKLSQAISTINFTPSALAIGRPNIVSTTASSGLPVTFNSVTLNNCTVNGTTLTNTTVGVCTVVATQGGNTKYKPASPVTKIATIVKGTQIINAINFTPDTLTVGGTTTVSATATSGLPVSLSTTTSPVCTLDGDVVSGISAGTCTIAANQAGDNNWRSATQVKGDLTVTSCQTSCLAIKNALPNAQTGIYTIDPDGANGSITPFQVYCDMDNDGGGWALIAKLFDLTLPTEEQNIATLLTDAQPASGQEGKLADATINALSYQTVRVIPSGDYATFFFQPGTNVWDFSVNGAAGNLDNIPVCEDAAMTVNCVTRTGVIDHACYTGYRNYTGAADHAFTLNHCDNLGFAGRVPYSADWGVSATVWVR